MIYTILTKNEMKLKIFHYIFQIGQGKSEEKGDSVMARNFMSGTAEVDDQQVSNSSNSDEKTRSSTPQNNQKLETDRDSSELVQVWDPSKRPALNPPNAVDQSAAEATMRKARVSVRARSEAHMVCIVYMCASISLFNF
jgi:hypothetical protein